jgi:hypothetical protein
MKDNENEKKWREEFLNFADTERARDFCFGNYNNATRDEQVGAFCYLEACRARQVEIEFLKAEVDKANREVFSMVEIHKNNREEIESLKAEIDYLKKELKEWSKYED